MTFKNYSYEQSADVCLKQSLKQAHAEVQQHALTTT